jgi:hypothetical protein
MNTYVNLWYLPEFFLEWEILQANLYVKPKYTFYVR